MLFKLRFLLLVLLPVFVISACAVYDVDKANDTTLSGSLNRVVNKDRGRYQPLEENKTAAAPIYVDYSKSNPLLRHDDELDRNKKYSSEDPFEERVEFSEYQRMKQKQQAKRNMQQRHQVDDEEAGTSLW